MDHKRFPSTPHPPIRLEITLSAKGAACQIPSHSYRCPSAAAAITNETKRSPVRRNNSQTALTSTFPPTVIKKVPAISSKQAAAVSTRSRPVPRVPTPPVGMDPGNNPPPTFRSSVAALHGCASAGGQRAVRMCKVLLNGLSTPGNASSPCAAAPQPVASSAESLRPASAATPLVGKAARGGGAWPGLGSHPSARSTSGACGFSGEQVDQYPNEH